MIRKNTSPSDEPPVGNIFGWRVSLIGLAFILLLAALAAYRHYALAVPVGFDDPLQQEERQEYHQNKAARERALEDSIRRQRK